MNDSTEKLFENVDHMMKWDGMHLRLKKDDVAGMWDQNYFLVIAQGDKIELLRKVHDQFKKKNIAFIYSMHVFHLNSGIGFAFADLLEEVRGEEFKEADLSHYRLTKAAEATGIKSLLEEKGKRWFALRADWANEEETELRWWLNPMEQEKNNSGWFNLEELKQWAEGKGPVIKGNERKKKAKINIVDATEG
jgi:hypothetical protein